VFIHRLMSHSCNWSLDTSVLTFSNVASPTSSQSQLGINEDTVNLAVPSLLGCLFSLQDFCFDHFGLVVSIIGKVLSLKVKMCYNFWDFLGYFFGAFFFVLRIWIPFCKKIHVNRNWFPVGPLIKYFSGFLHSTKSDSQPASMMMIF